MRDTPLFSAVLPCGGTGTRMGAGENKLFLPLLGLPCLAHTLCAMEEAAFVSEIILAVREEEKERLEALCQGVKCTKPVSLVAGGEMRQDSVQNGVVAAREDRILVHDGARCLISPSEIDRVAADAVAFGAAAMGVMVKDTLKRVDEHGIITQTVPRESLVRIQTPQAFCKDDYLRAIEAAEKDGFVGTDESSLLERIGVLVHLTRGSEENIKLTTPDDIYVAEAILQRRQME